jgi:hypothetical protein
MSRTVIVILRNEFISFPSNINLWTAKRKVNLTALINVRYRKQKVSVVCDCLCGLVVTVLGYRSRGQGSIPSTIRFPEK